MDRVHTAVVVLAQQGSVVKSIATGCPQLQAFWDERRARLGLAFDDLLARGVLDMQPPGSSWPNRKGHDLALGRIDREFVSTVEVLGWMAEHGWRPTTGSVTVLSDEDTSKNPHRWTAMMVLLMERKLKEEEV